MRCIVTAGPTFEKLDDVRRLTNFSTGRLGSELARYLEKRGHEVQLLLGASATWREETASSRTRLFTSTADLREQLRALSGGADAVFHAAAVSDFTFGKIWSRAQDGQLEEVRAAKIPTRGGALLAELVPTPKIIAELRAWFPGAWLVGWKYEADGARADAVKLAESQVLECRTDACVANGPAYGEGFGLVKPGAPVLHFPKRENLFAALAGSLEEQKTGASARGYG